jgi:arylsulfatase
MKGSGPRRIPLPVSGRPPNVLLIVTDQERARHLLPETLSLPQRERLMERSTVFRNAHAATNLCSMSRGNLYTGLHAQHNGVWENAPVPWAGALRQDVPTLGHLFQDAGYVTGYFGKWHLTSIPPHDPPGTGSMRRLFRVYGFDESDQDGERDGAWHGFRFDPGTAASTMRFLEGRRGDDRPWFAAVNFVNPHDIMFFQTSIEQRESRFMRFPDALRPAPDHPVYAEDLGFDLPDRFGPATLEGKPPAQREYQRVMELALGEIPVERHDLWRSYQNYYFNCLRDVDRHVGHVLDGLEATGQADRTVIVFVSDHGEMLGVHGLREKGGVVYRESSNVPLWIRHPDVEGGTETDALASQIDLVPTLLALAGVSRDDLHERHPELPGVDLSRALGRTAPRAVGAGGRDTLLLQWTSLIQLSAKTAAKFARIREGTIGQKLATVLDIERDDLAVRRGHMRGLFDGRFKLARYFSPRDHHRPEDFDALVSRNDLELYDTLADPGETRNLAAAPEAHRDRIEALNRKLLALVDREIGRDDGSYLPGPTAFWSA